VHAGSRPPPPARDAQGRRAMRGSGKACPTVRGHTCPHGGTRLHRDPTAASNILVRGKEPQGGGATAFRRYRSGVPHT
jgi:transposase